MQWKVGAGELSRTPRHIRRANPGLCKIEVVTGGHAMIDQMGRRIRLGPGDFTFTDLSRPVHWRTTASSELACVIFPRELLPARHDDLAGILNVRFNGDRGTGALITALTRQLPDHLDSYRAASGARLGTVIVDLVSVALAERFGRADEVPPGSHRRALLTRIYASSRNTWTTRGCRRPPSPRRITSRSATCTSCSRPSRPA